MNAKVEKSGVLVFGGKRRTAAIVIIGLSAVLGAFVLLGSLPSGKIASGVYVDSLNLGGLTREEAIEKISNHSFFDTDSFSVYTEGKTLSIRFNEVEMQTDAEAIANQAFGICRSKNKLANMWHVLELKFSKANIPVLQKADTLKLDAKLSEFGTQLYGQLKQHDVEILDGYVLIIPGKSGCGTNMEKARNQVLESISKKKTDSIHIDLDYEKPKELDADSLYSSVYRQAEDARYDVENSKVNIINHVVGIEIDKSEAKKKLQSLKEGGEAVKIPIKTTMPSVTSEILKQKLFNATLSSYSTKYSTQAENRAHNVELAASKINGTILAAGEVFSYNDTVGPRTLSRGFKNAPVYENGKAVDGIGGGVCQVSTTLYSAVLYADLDVVSRTNHSLTVSYVPLGQDATVVDGSIDFKFKNSTEYPIKISAHASGGTINISIIGTKRDVERTVKLEHTTVSEIMPTVKETQTAELPSGTRKVVSKGKPGYVINSVKLVYENGKQVSSVSLGKSTYKMVPEEVEVGIGAASSTKTDKPTSAANSPQPVASPAPTSTVAPVQTPAVSAAVSTKSPVASNVEGSTE